MTQMSEAGSVASQTDGTKPWFQGGKRSGLEEEGSVPSSGLGASTTVRNKGRREAELRVTELGEVIGVEVESLCCWASHHKL